MRYFFQPPQTSLFSAVDDAVTAAVGAIPLPGADAPTDDETVVVDDPATSDEPVVAAAADLDEFGLSKAEQIEGRQLLAGLKDPAKSGKIIDFLATQAGYKKGEIETPKEAKIAAKGLVEELKEALGPELGYLAEKMGPVFENRLLSQLEETTKPLKDRLDEAATEKSTAAANVAQEAISKEFFGDKGIPKDLSAEMEKVMDTLPFNGTMQSYLKDVLFVAAGRKGLVLTKGTVAKPRDTTIDRLQTTAGRQQPRVGETAAQPARQMTIDEAVRGALEAVKAESAKK